MNSMPPNQGLSFGCALELFKSRSRVVGVVVAMTFSLFAMVVPSAAQISDSPWGEPSGGLRCRTVTVHSSMSEREVDFRQGVGNFQELYDLAFAVELENVGDKSLTLLDTRYGHQSKRMAKADWFGQFFFSIELFDDAGNKIESPEVRLVDALDSAPIATIEPGASHRYLLRPMKWLSVMRPPLAAGRYRAVVHYHGLTKETANRIREYMPNSVMLGAWSGNVESLPSEFEIASLGNDSFEVKSWGEPSGGLRSALEIVPGRPDYAFGEKLDLKLHVQNVSEKPITLATHLWLSEMRLTVKDEQGNPVDVRARFYTGWTLSGRITLRPQQTTILDAGNLAIAADEVQADRFGHVTNRMLIAPAGTYSAQLSGHFGAPDFLLRDGKGKQLAPLEGDWSGDLTTGPAPLVVSETNVQ